MIHRHELIAAIDMCIYEVCGKCSESNNVPEPGIAFDSTGNPAIYFASSGCYFPYLFLTSFCSRHFCQEPYATAIAARCEESRMDGSGTANARRCAVDAFDKMAADPCELLVLDSGRSQARDVAKSHMVTFDSLRVPTSRGQDEISWSATLPHSFHS